MKKISLGEVKITTIEFKYIRMLEKVPRATILSSFAKKLKGRRTETEKEVPGVISIRESHAVPLEN